MKIQRRAISFIIILAMVASLFTGVTFAADEPGVSAAFGTETATIHGRYLQDTRGGEDSYVFSHGAAGFGANFTGSEFWMYVPAAPMENDAVRKVKVAVVLDRAMAMDATMVEIDHTGWICLASGLTEGEHHIEVRKKERGFSGLAQTDWFAVSRLGVAAENEILTPDEASDLVIEVYGDSISNGDAVWYENGKNSAYTYGNWTGVIERLLGAEMRVTGNTGNGLLGWALATKNDQLDNLYPPQANWDKVDPYSAGDTAWSHKDDNAADVVIINLGTNDRIELSNGDMTAEMFENEYIRFIKQIKKDCPKATVICTVGAMGLLKDDNYEVSFDRILDECNKISADPFVYYVELQKCDTIGANYKVSSLKDGKATDIPAGAGYDGGHPSNLAGEVYGLQFATLINKVLKLGKTLPTDVPAYAYEKRTGKTAPEGSILEAIKANANTLSYIDEVIARTQSSAKNLALDATVIVSTEAEDHAKEKVADGDTTTYWESTELTDQYAGLVWDEAQTIGKLVIRWGGGRPETAHVAIEISDDLATWTPLTVKLTREDVDDTHHNDMITLAEPVTTKAIRVYIDELGNTKPSIQCWDFEAYAPGSTEVNVTAGATVIVSSAAEDHPKENVTDTDLNSYWESTTVANEYIGLAWDEAQTITKLIIRWGGGCPETEHIAVEISDDLETWTPLTVTPSRENVDDTHHNDTIAFADPVTTKAIRVYIDEMGNQKTSIQCWGIEAYAPKQEETTPGDMDGDGNVGATDLTALARHVGQIEEITDPKFLKNADMDGDGGIGATDLTLLARKVAQID